MEIRSEEPADALAIAALTKRAFADVPYADGSEPAIIDRLRRVDALSLSLVAVENGQIIGHAAFSPASGNGKDWYALGPISVAPERQRQGIGSALIQRGFEVLQKRSAKGCILVGNPAYYSRFGFRPAPELCAEGLPAEYFMLAVFGLERPENTFVFHPAFFGEPPESSEAV